MINDLFKVKTLLWKEYGKNLFQTRKERKRKVNFYVDRPLFFYAHKDYDIYIIKSYYVEPYEETITSYKLK